MNKIQKIIKFVKSEIVFFFFAFTIIIILFLDLNPKLSNQLLSLKREATVNNFLNETKKSQRIDSRRYWEFREFYSPGVITFSKTGVDAKLLKNTKELIGLGYKEDLVDSAFIVFSSPKLNSIDMLTIVKDLNLIFVKPKGVKVLLDSKNIFIYKSDSKTIKIIFLLGNKDMQSANGFFDYQDNDKKITAGKNWLNVTSLTID